METIEKIPEGTILEGNKNCEETGCDCGCLKRAHIIWIAMLTVLVASFFGAVFGFMSAGATNVFSSSIGQRFENIFGKDQNQSNLNRQQILIEDSAVIDAVKNSSPAVVSVIISKNVPKIQSFFDPFFGFGGNMAEGDQGEDIQQQIGGGSGFFISSDGLILTNRHVVDDQRASYTVMTSDGKEYKATILARDPVRDAAIIKIDGNNFPVLELGDSDSLQIGETVIAIGNSLGEFSNTVSRGIVSGLKRNLSAGSDFGNTERLTDIVQTDAAINPGNSGGPLIDISGKVIGINVAMAQGAQNVGFALPINQAKRIIEQVKSGVKVTVPYLGVRYIPIDDSVKNDAQLPFNYGALVLRGTKMTDLAVVPGSPADKAGIVENDIILEVNGQKVDTDNQLGDLISKHNVGDKITLKIWHKGDTKNVSVTLQELKN